MSTIRNPVGPQPPGVYWKRRALVLLGLVAIVVIIALIIMRPGSGTPAATTKSPSPTATSVAEGAKACDPADIQLTAITDKNGYNVGETPLISMSITNTGSTACTVNAGTDAQEYLILSGTEQYWSSRDCQADEAPTETTLQPAVPQSTNPFPWDRTRSTTTTCDAARPAVAAGGASYHLTVKLGDLESADSKQFLLY